MEKAQYNKNQIKEAMQKVKDFNITTRKKVFHKTLLYDMKKLIDNELYKINDSLFYSDYIYTFYNYKNNVNINYNTVTKKELDQNLRWLKIDLLNQLQKILELDSEYFII